MTIPVDALALHVPDGFLQPRVALVTAVLSGLAVAAALRSGSTDRPTDPGADAFVPLAGITAAFVFAAQMVNFPVAAGTSGHLIGAALAAILLGPRLGSLVTTVVVVVQALLFADGGITALGVNVLNMAVVPAYGGWAAFHLARAILPSDRRGVIGATGLAAGGSVVLSAATFSLEWLFGATAPVPFDTVFGAMVGVHLLIGVGEGIISGLIVGTVLATRPDLVAGAADLPADRLAGRDRIGRRPFVIGAVLSALLVATVVSQFASSAPDGLERVAREQGFEDEATEHALGDTVFAGYATRGLGNEGLSLAVAGVSGVLVTLAVGHGLVSAMRRPDRDTAADPATDPPGR